MLRYSFLGRHFSIVEKGLSTQNCFITKQTVSRASNKPQRKVIRCSYIRLMRDYLFKKQGFWKLVKYFCVVFGVTEALSISVLDCVVVFRGQSVNNSKEII